jgi:hypothetical protein
MKLQHSGLATVAVYHIPHGVVHHNDSDHPGYEPQGPRTLVRLPKQPAGILDRGPDFAERGFIQSSSALGYDVGRRARHYFVVDFG